MAAARGFKIVWLYQPAGLNNFSRVTFFQIAFIQFPASPLSSSHTTAFVGVQPSAPCNANLLFALALKVV